MKKKTKKIERLPLKITAKNFYGNAWINVIEFGSTLKPIVIEKFYKTKKAAKEAYPAMVDRKFQRIVKVMLVEF